MVDTIALPHSYPKMTWSQVFSDARIHDCACQWRCYSRHENRVYIGFYYPYLDGTYYQSAHYEGDKILAPLSEVKLLITMTKEYYQEQLIGFQYFLSKMAQLNLPFFWAERYDSYGKKAYEKIFVESGEVKIYKRI